MKRDETGETVGNGETVEKRREKRRGEEKETDRRPTDVGPRGVTASPGITVEDRVPGVDRWTRRLHGDPRDPEAVVVVKIPVRDGPPVSVLSDFVEQLEESACYVDVRKHLEYYVQKIKSGEIEAPSTRGLPMALVKWMEAGEEYRMEQNR